MKTFFSRTLKNSKAQFVRPAGAHQTFLFAAFSFLIFSTSIDLQVAAQAPPDKTTGGTVILRPCPAIPGSSKPASKDKPKRKGAVAHLNEPAPACLEAKASALDIQEFFQSFVRTQGWNIGEEQGTEDLWTFARYLTKEELLRFAREGLFAGRVNWRDGRTLVQVRTVELDGGFTRVLVSARFEGYGQSVDQFAPPKESWHLDSNGSLENSMVSALEAHFKSLR